MNQKRLIERLKPIQSDGNPHPCPRCGLRAAHTRSAISREADIYICDECGTDEALRAAANLAPLPFDYWNCADALAELHDEEGCEFCRLFDFGESRALVEDHRYAHISNAGASYRFPAEQQFNYGFKIAYTGSGSSVTLTVRVKGGMT